MKKCIFLLIVITIISSLSPKFLISQDAVADLQTKINEYTAKIEELTKSKDTLSNQIKLITSQIDLTLLKITQTESSVKALETDISVLTVEIDKLDIYLNQLSSIYINQVAENYKLQKRTPSLAIFSTNNFNGFLEQLKYLSLAQKSNHDMLINMETVRTNYDIQKEEKKKKQIELENLQIKLAEQRNSLDKQKTSKANLLAITQNDEKKYQQLKKAAETELSSLLQAKFVGKRNVKKGEALGLMGNSGYSFGDHLHFGLYNLREEDLASWSYPNDIDSSDYINSHRWPMNQPIEITQGRGVTKYSYLYSDRFHHGIDMVSSNKSILAVEDGVAYFFRNPGSSLGNHVKLFHPDGKMTLYLHMQ